MTTGKDRGLAEFDVILAHHEAGHAVAAWAMKVPVICLHLAYDTGYAKHGLRPRILESTTMDRGDWNYVRSKALILLAGEYAERCWHDLNGNPGEEWYASEYDRKNLKDLLSEANGDYKPIEGFSVLELEQATLELVIHNWRRIEALASCLLVRRSLSGPEAEKIIKSGKPTPPGQLI